MNDLPTLASVQIGHVAPLGPNAVPSAFVKHPVAGPVQVGLLGLDGDAQADHRVHGGRDKAVYAYAASRYAEWRADFPEHAGRLGWGAFGENLTVAGMDETDICVGDVHGIGTARLQVCQPRQPCFKFALHFADNRMPKAMTRNGRAGWYYRVLEEGILRAGDTLRLLERPNPALGFPRIVRIAAHGEASAEEWALLAEAEGIAESLRRSARKSLAF